MKDTSVQALKAHVAIPVADLKRSVDFYSKLFGVDPAKVREGCAKFDLANPPLNFTISEAPGARGGLSRQLSHLGIQVASSDDVAALRERWAQQGLIPRDEMNTECCYALQDKTWVRDPDGNEWEAFVVLQDHLPEKAAGDPAACCAPGCCA